MYLKYILPQSLSYLTNKNFDFGYLLIMFSNMIVIFTILGLSFVMYHLLEIKKMIVKH